MTHVYCPECGFQNPEAANYCSKCGALLVKDESGTETTQQYTPEEGDDEAGAQLEDLGLKGPALIVRSGGGRSGETFHPEGERTRPGKRSVCTPLSSRRSSRRRCSSARPANSCR